MLLACAIAVVAVALGLALGLAPVGRARIAGPLRTFALSAVLTAVLLHLLPEALTELGAVALGLFVAASVFPAWVRLVRGVRGESHGTDGALHGGLVAGYVGLLVHHVGDGLGLGAYAALPGGAVRNADVMLALAAHTVPLVAVVAFAFQRAAGSRAAFRAASGLAGASVLGVVLSSMVPESLVEQSAAWIAALVAGLLAHVVTHDLDRDLPKTHGSRLLDALAAAAGVATGVFGGEHAAGHHSDAFLASAVSTFGSLSLPVIAGLVLAAIVARVSVLPLRSSFAAAFGPGLGVDGLVVAIWLGAAWGWLYALAALGVALAVRSASPKSVELAPAAADPKVPWLVHLDDTVTEALGWIAAAFAVWSLLGATTAGQTLEIVPLPLALVLAVVIALPVRIPAVAAVIIADAFARSGLRLEAAVVIAVLGPAPGAVELAAIARRESPRASARAALTLALSGLAIGAVAAVVQHALSLSTSPLVAGLRSRLPFLVLAALFVRATYERGLRALLLSVFPSHDTAASEPAEPAEPEASANRQRKRKRRDDRLARE